MTVTIRPFDHAPDSPDWTAHRAFADRVYGPEAGARLERAMRWVTLENPVDLDEPRRYVAVEGGRIVASEGRLPVRFNVFGSPYVMRWAHDLLVDPDYRGQKLGQRLYEEIAVRSDSLVGGLWMNDPSYAIARKAGWRAMQARHAQIRFLDTGALMARRMPRPAARVAGLALRAGLALASVDAWRGRGGGFEVEEIERFTSGFDALWAEVSKRLGIAAVRDSAYLRWRFDRSPQTTYARLVARKKSVIRGYLVLRFSAAREPGSAAVAVDMLAPPDEPEVITALVLAALERARAGGADALVAFTTLPPFRRCLARLGFLRTPRLQTFVLGNLETCADAERLADADTWYLTFTDSDGDVWAGAGLRERI